MGHERISDRRLHEYFDGELSPDEASEVRRRIEADPALGAKLEGLREVRAVVRASVAPEMASTPSEDLWARIEAGIAASSDAEAKPGLRVVPGGRDERPRAAEPRMAAEPNRRGRVVGLVITGLALAAAVLLLILRPGEPTPGASPDQVATGDTDVLVEPTVVPEETAEELVFRTEVLEVDFGSNTGAVFSVEGENGGRYAVVWLADVQPKRTTAEQ